MTKSRPITAARADGVVSGIAKQATPRRKASALSLVVTVFVVPGLFATLALPAYAATATPNTAQQAHAALARKVRADAQTVAVPTSAVPAAAIRRDQFGATSEAQLQSAQLAAARSTQAASSGPSLRALLANPPYPSFDLAQVVAVAEQYQGVPYVFGGASPAGFDCSGFTEFVYAHFGIALPHSAAAQGRIGTAISRADALPGDVVVIDGGSHVGIYLGGGRMIDAPEAGGVVSERAIWTDGYYIVRFGI